MSNYNGKLVELPKKVKPLLLQIFMEILMIIKDIWIYGKNVGKKILILSLQAILSMLWEESDKSIEILDSVKHYWEKCEYFYPLIGNHEWSTISDISVYKGGIDQSLILKNF